MNYPIQAKPDERGTYEKMPVNETVMAAAIAGVIRHARQTGQTLDDLKAEILADDRLLGWAERCLLSDIVAEAWEKIA